MASSYDPKIGEKICLAISEGYSIEKAILGIEGCPRASVILAWMRDYPDFFAMYEVARDMKADLFHDRIGDIVERIEQGDLNPFAGKVIIDALSKMAGKIAPTKYGDTKSITINRKDKMTPDQRLQRAYAQLKSTMSRIKTNPKITEAPKPKLIAPKKVFPESPALKFVSAEGGS